MNADVTLADQRLKTLFDRTFQNEEFAGHLEWVSVEWMNEMRNPHAGNIGDLGRDGNFKHVPLEQLWDDLLAKGMADPLVISAGITDGRARLDSGNHRIQTYLSNGILVAPAVCVVGDDVVVTEGNGSHLGREATIHKDAAQYKGKFVSPSKVLPTCPSIPFNGF